jgi:hypothetical protein
MNIIFNAIDVGTKLKHLSQFERQRQILLTADSQSARPTASNLMILNAGFKAHLG